MESEFNKGSRKEKTNEEEGEDGDREDDNKQASFGKNDIVNTKHRSIAIIKSRLAALAQIGEDWLYLASLGAIMALISFSMDGIIAMFLSNRLWLFHDLTTDNLIIQYLGWCVPPIVLVSFSAGFVHLCSPTVGSYLRNSN